MINAEFGLHELAIEAALHERQRRSSTIIPAICSSAPKQSVWGPPGELVAREIAVFITNHALITVRKATGQVMLTGGPGLRWR
jgi:hypothetical protein